MKKLLLSILCFTTIFAQNATLNNYQIPLGSRVDLSSIPDSPWMVTVSSDEGGQHLTEAEKIHLANLKLQQSTKYPFTNESSEFQNSTRTVADPVVMKLFNANAESGSVPLDNYFAISKNGRIASCTNTLFQTYDSSGTIIKNLSLASFSSSLGLIGSANGKFDPKVMYDPYHDRFIAVILNGFAPTTSKIILGFSVSNKPDSAWNLYTLSGNPFNDTTWFDYPAINITENEVFITGNQLNPGLSWLIGFNQSIIWQIDKHDGYNGDTLTTNLWSNIQYGGRNIRNLHPVKGGSSFYGPEQYFLSNRNLSSQNDSIFILKINDTIGAPGLSLSVNLSIADKKYGFPPNVPMKNFTDKLATNDGRVLGAFIENDKIYFVSNTIDTTNGNAGIYFGEMSNIATSGFDISAHIISQDTLGFGYPNISWAGNNATGSDCIISFNHSGSNRFPGMSTILYSEGSFSNLVSVKEGVSFLSALGDTVERWGDYFGSQPFYDYPGVVWIAGTYGNTGANYRTAIAKIHNVQIPNVSIEENTSLDRINLYPNPGIEFTNIDFIMEKESMVEILLFDYQGKLITSLFKGIVYDGNNNLRFNIGSLATGNYIVKIIPTNSKAITKKFVKM